MPSHGIPSTVMCVGAPDLAVLSKKDELRRAGGMGNQDYRIRVLRAEDGSAVVVVAGEIDIASSLSFGERLSAVLDEGAERVVVDLTSAACVDTTGLSVLWESAKRCRLESRELVIVCCAGKVRHALANSGLDQVVATRATLDEALGHRGPHVPGQADAT